MKRTLCLLLALAPIAAYAGDEKKPGELTDPTEILKKVDAAAKAVKAVQYDVVLELPASTTARSGVEKIEATFISTGWVGGGPEKYVVEATVKQVGQEEPRRITAGTDADMYYIVDHKNKIAYEDLDPAVMGSVGALLGRAGMAEYTHPTPFTDELNGKSRDLKGSEKVGDEDCYIVHVVYASDQAPQGTWSFSKKDFLPRRRVDVRGTGGKTTKTVTKLVVDPKFDADTFKLKLPEGYSKTDDFAPSFLGGPSGGPR